ncbi:DUF5829 family protein [Negadavirga shengliensis]|uniref:DUF5829 family protein n=1 Tax=Negadavirga shengliensis TaxID=1389218 RepID=A0ABV9T2V4_9BACT
MRMHPAYFFLFSVSWLVYGNTLAQDTIENPVEFDHMYTVIPEETYQRIINHPIMREVFCNMDRGRPDFSPITPEKKEAYFRFNNHYFELLSSANKWQEPVNQIGIGWVTATDDAHREVYNSLQRYGDNLHMENELDNEGRPQHHTIYVHRQNTSKRSLLNYWIYAYSRDFLENLYGKQPEPFDFTGKAYWKSSYNPAKLASHLVEIGVGLNSEEASVMTDWLSALGFSLERKEDGYLASSPDITFSISVDDQTGANLLIYLRVTLNKECFLDPVYFSDDCFIEFLGKEAYWWFRAKK